MCVRGLIADSKSGYFTVFGFGGDPFYVCKTQITKLEKSLSSFQSTRTAKGIWCEIFTDPGTNPTHSP